MVGAAKASASVGSVVVAALCYFIIRGWTIAASWPNLLFIMTGIAGVILLYENSFCGVARMAYVAWPHRDAEKAVHYLLGKDVYMPVPPQQAATEGQPSDSMWTFMRKNVRKILFTGVPWACEGLGVYGIGIFIPILIMSLGIDYVSPTAPRYGTYCKFSRDYDIAQCIYDCRVWYGACCGKEVLSCVDADLWLHWQCCRTWSHACSLSVALACVDINNRICVV